MEDYLKLKYTREDIVRLFMDSVVPYICETAAFQRLKGISFLGAVERTPAYSKRRNNRFDHSVGVALLAQYYAKKMGFSEADRTKVVVAALLHDIGHAPLSHSIEPLFAERFGLNHHVATENILRGDVALGKGLHSALSKFSIDADELINLMSGSDSSKLGRIFSLPINVDTVEAIWRGGTYVRKQFFHPLSVMDAFIECDFKSGSIIDRFWTEKHSFYWLMIYSKDGVAADYWARERVGSNSNLTPDDFYLTEKHFLGKYIAGTVDKIDPVELDIKVRHFEVDDHQNISSYEGIPSRYKVVKSRKLVMLYPPKKSETPVNSTLCLI